MARALPPPRQSPKHQAQSEQRRAARLERFERVRELHDNGWPLRAIGQERLRRALSIPTGKRTILDGKVALPEPRPLTPRTAVWQVLQRPEQQDEATEERIKKLRQAHLELAEAIMLTEGFATLIRARDPASLDRWLEQAAASTLTSFQSFAASLRRDDKAVRAGVEQKKRRNGPGACPFNLLYWNFLLEHEQALRANPRLGPAVLGLGRLGAGDWETIRREASIVLEQLCAA